MKLAHVLSLLTLIAPITCDKKYLWPPKEVVRPTKEEKISREAWLDTLRNIAAACEKVVVESRRPEAQFDEQLNLHVVGVQKATAKAANRFLAGRDPMDRNTCYDLMEHFPKVAAKCHKALDCLRSPELACSDALTGAEKRNLGTNLRMLRYLFTVYQYNFSKRCQNDTRIEAPPLPKVEFMWEHLMKTAKAYMNIEEYCKSKGVRDIFGCGVG